MAKGIHLVVLTHAQTTDLRIAQSTIMKTSNSEIELLIHNNKTTSRKKRIQ